MLYFRYSKGEVNMIYTVYAKEDDMTFIMERTENTLSVIGFYFGEPNEDDTEFIAEYDSEEFANCYTIIGDADDLIDYLKSH